jgi:hypothetical protein
VEWNTSAIDWSATGEVEVAGSGVDVFGAPFEATATVEVGAFTAVQPTSVTTYAGASLARVRAAAPITAPAEVRAGGPAYETPVTWDWSGVADASFAETGTVTVPGTVEIEGGTLPATLAVIVTEATERNVAPDSAASATFTESPSYGIERTINGVTGDKGWSNWRSGTKNTTDTLSYALAERTQVRHASVQFYRDGGATWPQRLRVEHRLTGGEWSTGSWVDVPAQDAGAPLIDVPLGNVDADEVRVVMEARPATHIVVSEVQIFGLSPSASSVNALARLTVDGEPVAGFAADTTEYRVAVEGAGWPRLAALAVDRDAAVRITQPDAGNGTGTVTVTAPDGSERTYTVTIERAGTGPQPSPEPSGPGASPSPSTVPNAGGPAASGTGSGALAATGADAGIWLAPALLGAAVAAAGVVLFVRRRPRGTAE